MHLSCQYTDTSPLGNIGLWIRWKKWTPPPWICNARSILQSQGLTPGLAAIHTSSGTLVLGADSITGTQTAAAGSPDPGQVTFLLPPTYRNGIIATGRKRKRNLAIRRRGSVPAVSTLVQLHASVPGIRIQRISRKKPSVLKAVQAWSSHSKEADLAVLRRILMLQQSKVSSYFQP